MSDIPAIQCFGRWPWRHRCLRPWLIGLLTLSFVVLSHGFSDPILAQNNPKAFVEVDGRPIFQLEDAGIPAERRAEAANEVLAEIVSTQKPIEVEVVTQNNLPVLRVNDQYLLTVTDRDAPTESLDVQSAKWRDDIAAALKRGREQRQLPYLRDMALVSLSLLGIAGLAHFLVKWFWRVQIPKLLPQVALDPQTGDRPLSLQFLLTALRLGVQLCIWGGILTYISALFPWTRTWKRQIIASLFSPLITFGDQSYSVLELVILGGMLVGLVSLANLVKHLLRTRVLSLTGISRGSQEAIAFISNYALIFIGTLVLLQLWGLDLSSLTILASALGVGVGLGLQGIAKEFVSGLVIIFEQPIQVGDFIEVAGHQGMVTRINVRSTEIRTLDQISIIVPNSRFLETEVINWHHNGAVSRLQIPVGVAYESDPSAVRAALMDAAKEHPDVLAEPKPRVFFTNFGDSALNFTLLVWICEPEKQNIITSDLNFRIEAILRHRNITIPFPQRDLHVRSGHLPLELPVEMTQAIAQLSQSLVHWLNQQNGSAIAKTHRVTHDVPQKAETETDSSHVDTPSA